MRWIPFWVVAGSVIVTAPVLATGIPPLTSLEPDNLLVWPGTHSDASEGDPPADGLESFFAVEGFAPSSREWRDEIEQTLLRAVTDDAPVGSVRWGSIGSRADVGETGTGPAPLKAYLDQTVEIYSRHYPWPGESDLPLSSGVGATGWVGASVVFGDDQSPGGAARGPEIAIATPSDTTVRADCVDVNPADEPRCVLIAWNNHNTWSASDMSGPGTGTVELSVTPGTADYDFIVPYVTPPNVYACTYITVFFVGSCSVVFLVPWG